MSDFGPDRPSLGPLIEHGDWAGWRSWTGHEPFEEYVGPFYARREETGQMVCGSRVKPQTLNGAGSVHGGALLTFADYSLFLIAYDAIQGESCVTVSLTGEFVAAAPAGALLTCRGDVLKSGGSLVFVRGLVDHEGTPLLNFSGVIRVFRSKR